MIQDVLQRVSADRIRRDLFYLCRDPLPFRKVNYYRRGRTWKLEFAHVRSIPATSFPGPKRVITIPPPSGSPLLACSHPRSHHPR